MLRPIRLARARLRPRERPVPVRCLLPATCLACLRLMFCCARSPHVWQKSQTTTSSASIRTSFRRIMRGCCTAVAALRGERVTLDAIIHMYYLSCLWERLWAQSVFFNTTTRPGQVRKRSKPLFTTMGRRAHVVGGLGVTGKRTTNYRWSLSTV